MHQERAVDAGIPVIAETTTTFPFEKTLKVGDRFEIPGIAEAKFVLTLEQSEYY